MSIHYLRCEVRHREKIFMFWNYSSLLKYSLSFPVREEFCCEQNIRFEVWPVVYGNRLYESTIEMPSSVKLHVVPATCPKSLRLLNLSWYGVSAWKKLRQLDARIVQSLYLLWNLRRYCRPLRTWWCPLKCGRNSESLWMCFRFNIFILRLITLVDLFVGILLRDPNILRWLISVKVKEYDG